MTEGAAAPRGAVPIPEDVQLGPRHWIRRLPGIGGVAGLAALAGGLVLARGVEDFLFSWLLAFVFFLSISLGCLFFVLALLSSDGRWGTPLRRLAENTMVALPLFALLFLPVWFGREVLFEWARPERVAEDALLRAKSAYLDPGFFLLRAAAYFAVWSALAIWFSRESERQDRTGDGRRLRRMQAASAPSLAAFGLTVSFASVDWLMSLEPHWYSTIFGVYVFSGSVVAGFAFLVVAAFLLQGSGRLRTVVTVEHYHDLGKLLFGFTIFWSYIAFSQYMLIWYANIPEETIFYLRRMEGSWRSASVLLAIGHFGVPFLYLMPRGIKRRRALLVSGALWMLLMHALDLYWIVMPVGRPHGAAPTLLDLAAFVAVGGFWVGAIGWTTGRRALVPVGDPRLSEALAYDNP
jgi:hypothetical protein